jgi:glutamate-1-semialdehyde 2,1-aminomutase
LLVIDEISAGFRLTTGGAHLVVHHEVPDIAVFSKALGNGYPIAAIIGKAEPMQSAQKTFISSTYWTERIGPVAAIANIKKHKDLNVAAHLIALGEQVQEGWRNLAHKHDLEVRVSGIKPMSHFSFAYEVANVMKAYFIQLMLEQGFLASNLFYSMYVHTVDHVELYLEAVDLAFAQIKDAMNRGDLEKQLKGMPSATGFRRLA